MNAAAKVTNILIVGVGGQGVILASDIIAAVMMRAGHDVKKSEVHGMAQRGGSVTSHVRFGLKVYSPIIRKGEVDILFSFEQLETLRYLNFLNDKSVILVNDQKILPPSVTMGKDVYPADIPGRLKERYPRFTLVNALEAAREAGSSKAVNVALIGALSNCFAIEERLWHEAISSFLPAKLIELNLRAFELGRQRHSSCP